MDNLKTSPSFVARFSSSFVKFYQLLLECWTPYMAIRWLITVALISILILRIIYLQGFYLVAYCLAIYHIHLFIKFVTPKLYQQLDFDTEEDEYGPQLVLKSTADFMLEFDLWFSMTLSTIIGSLCTFIPFLNIPVFWPILVVYFVFLLLLSLRKQIKNIKYRFTRSRAGPQDLKLESSETNADDKQFLV